jgi:hypothetical protein
MNISSTKDLPQNYVKTAEVNLAANRGLALLMNILGLAGVLLSFWLLMALVGWLHPELASGTVDLSLGKTILIQIAILIGLAAFNTIVHELIHGAGFWLCTGERPVFALRLTYAYAAAPDWYIPKRHYWMIGLSPLVLIDVAAILLIWLAPEGLIMPAVIVAAFNTGGAVGDLWIVGRLLRTSSARLANDKGDGVTFYEPGNPSQNS